MGLLEVENLTKTFGGLTAVNNLSFHVDEGEILGIIGPNGAGKTTLFNLIAGFLKPDSGKVKFRGEDITGFAPHKTVKRGIARTFQVVRPFRYLPVIANVMVPLICSREASKIKRHGGFGPKALEILDEVGLSDMALEPAENLAHGNIKRLELARAIATNPDLLLLDEPFSGLHPREVENIIELIQRMHREGHTVVIVEHVLHALMKTVKRVVVLHFGVKIAEGKPEEIAKDKKVIEVYMGKPSRTLT